MKKILLTLTIIYSLFVITACPARSIEKAKDSSAKIATYSNVGVNITRDLYRGQLISLATKDRIADSFITLAKAGQAFDAAVLKLEAEYGPNAPPKAEIDKLFNVFDTEIVDRLVDILKTVTASGVPDKFREVVATLKSAVLVVAKILGRSSQVQAKFAGGLS